MDLQSQIMEAVKRADIVDEWEKKVIEVDKMVDQASSQLQEKIQFIDNLSKSEVGEALKLLDELASKDRWSFRLLKDRLSEQLGEIEDSE